MDDQIKDVIKIQNISNLCHSPSPRWISEVRFTQVTQVDQSTLLGTIACPLPALNPVCQQDRGLDRV